MPARPPSPFLAACLSLLFPGLGQAYAGRPRRGLLLAVPPLLLVGAVLALAAGGPGPVLAFLLRPAVVTGLLVVGVVAFAYHAVAILDAHRLAAGPRIVSASGHGRAGGATDGAVPLVALLAIALLLHGLPWYVGYRAAPNLAALFHEGDAGTDWIVPTPSWAVTPGSTVPATAATAAPSRPPGPTDAPLPSGGSPPAASPSPGGTPSTGPDWAADGQLNIVLLGSDEGPGRWSLRTDAVYLLSIEIETARAALFGFPRYMSNIPLPPEAAVNFRDGLFPGYINALYVAAQNNPRRYPGNDARGLRVVAGAVQELAGVTVDHYVMVNLNGFVQVIEQMGGLWVDVPEPGVTDDKYTHQRGFGHLRLRLKPGCQRLNGTMALAFARSRHQDGDYGRMARQEVTIQALRHQFDPLAVVPRLPELFDTAGDNLFWTLQPNDVGPIAELAGRIDADRIQRVLFIPPDYKRELNDERIELIRTKVRGIFNEPVPEPAGGAAVSCPPGG